MFETPRQLPLDLPVEARQGAEDFLVGPANDAAYGLIEAWPHWPDPVVLLVGPEGSGKSHLAAMWRERSGAVAIQASELDERSLQETVLASGPHAVLVEDCDRGRLDEHALFHLLNVMRTRGHALLTARSLPGAWGLVVPDLLSRLRLATLAEMGSPDDALLRAVLVKLIVDRQLMVDAGVIETLLTRMERSFAAAQRIVAALDHEALSRGRRITRVMANTVLQGMT
ncbi:Chromosomal replication initiator protein DnaA [Hyphomicrobiales bacterium]|nr:Chromosomal replication initiator protein DnaA [Hyphomicrobiales bacterium]CAH1665656.1 Chromosomal replication initiator protein DnaA [Hyphomicrobiales bacterium]